jgi:hypothetical protein
MLLTKLLLQIFPGFSNQQKLNKNSLKNKNRKIWTFFKFNSEARGPFCFTLKIELGWMNMD